MSYCAELSVRNLKWISPKENQKIKGLPETISDIVQNRNISDLETFFKPTFQNSMPDPSVLKCMDLAVESFYDALINKKRICVYGDYDVDGATSTSLLLHYLKLIKYKGDVMFYIPDRLTEGYGPNISAIEKIKSKGFEKIIFVDSGTTAFEQLKYANSIGLDPIVLDHHQAEDEIPEGILVNPKRLDDNSNLDYLCAAGLTFLFIVALQRKLRTEKYFSEENQPELKYLLGLVALGTVADVVPLVGLNRAYVKLGLKMIPYNLGLRKLMDVCQIQEESITSNTCGFVLGPCINAGGRISNTTMGTTLLTTEDEVEAQNLAQELYETNIERRSMQTKMVEEALTMASDTSSNENVIICYNEEWHPGFVGLVAARVKDKFDKTAIILGQGCKGSARSVEGFDVGSAIIEARNKGIILSGGGHTGAAGMSLTADNISTFKEFLEKKSHELIRPPLRVDATINCSDIKVSTIKGFNMLHPFGAGNPEPRMVIKNGYIDKTIILKGKHIKAFITDNTTTHEIILFNSIDDKLGQALLGAEGYFVDIYGKFKINEYAGNTTVQIIPEDIMIGKPISNNS